MRKGIISCLLFISFWLAGCQQRKEVEVQIIPQPQSSELSSGTYGLPRQAVFSTNLPEEDKKEFKVGDYVKITGLNSHGEIVDIRRNEATVLTNGMKMKVKISKLEPMHKPQIKKATYKAHVESVSSRFPLELNLIGMRVEEGIAALDKYLDQAVVKHIKQVRIIHGMGTGALRTAVWKDLKKQPNVSKFNSAGPSEGGLGATIVILK